MPSSDHLALFFSSLGGGGVQRIMLNLAGALAKRGVRIDLVVAEAEESYRDQTPASVRVVVLEKSGRLAGLWNAVTTDPAHLGGMLLPILRTVKFPQWFDRLPALVHYLREEQPAVLLAGGNYLNLLALWARQLAQSATRLVISQHVHLRVSLQEAGARKRWLQLPLIRRFYPWADEIIAVSHGVAEDLAQIAVLPRQRITTIYNPVVTPALLAQARASIEHPWFAAGNPPVLLSVGRFEPQKDFPTLLKAFGRVRTTRPVKLMILGDGKRRRQIESLVRRLGLTADVDILGFVVNPFAYMARARGLVLSSVFEGLPTVLIEAMACGCPVVSTDCPSGPVEILDGGRFGPLTPVRDDAALARAILSILDAPPDPEILRARASLFSESCTVDRYFEVLFNGVKWFSPLEERSFCWSQRR